MTSVAFELANPARPSPLLRFLCVHAGVWLAYGGALMLPWIGHYPIAVMLPNKLVIAASGLLASTLLRALYIRAIPGTTPEIALGVAASASLVVGVAWSLLLGQLVGRTAGSDLQVFGSLLNGVPRFGGALYEGAVLFVWSLLYLATGRPHDSRARDAVPSPPLHRAGQDNGLVVARDGSRALVTDAGEIDWVEAAGDYVRVHAGGRSVLLRGTMTQYELGLGSAYVRIHRSAIVHVGRVRELIARPNKEFVVLLRDGTRLRASRRYSARLLAALQPRAMD